MDRNQKEQTVETLKEVFSSANAVVVCAYTGLNVAQLTELRKDMRQSGASFKVVKNSLTRLAITDTQYEALTEHFTGPIAIAYSDDPVAAAKGVVNFANDNENLVILAGAINDEVIDVSRVQTLAKMPSLDTLRAKILSMINTPATRIAGVIQAPGGQIARVISAKAAKGE